MNVKVLNTIIAIVVVGLSFSCNSEKFQVSEDGFEYKYINRGSGDVPKEGEIVVYNMKYMNEKDSIIFETTAERPANVPCNMQQWETMGPLYKAFKMIKEDDSILIKIPTKTLFAESFKAPIPPGIDPEGSFTFCIGVSKMMTQEEMQADAKEMSKGQLDKDIEVIEGFLTENSITAQSTESGLRYVIEVEGAGNHPKPGENVKVHYTGTLLDGTKFDSSYDRNEPFSFSIGRGQVIPGWDEGIALLKPGGKGTLYIPSPLAYGPRGAGGSIKPNSVLKFDVELIEIEKIN